MCICTTRPHAACIDRVHCASYRSSLYSFMYTQARLLYESVYCPKDGCGSPMASYIHRGIRKPKPPYHLGARQCVLPPIRYISHRLTSLVSCTHVVPSVHQFITYLHLHRSNSFIVCKSLWTRPTGNTVGHTTNQRLQTELALCFCWGIANRQSPSPFVTLCM